MIKKIIVVLVIGLIIYAGIQFGLPQYHYYAFKSDLDELARITNLRPKELREEVMKSARDYNVPLNSKKLIITRNGGNRIQASWSETVNLFNLYEKTFHFSVDAKP